jgi:thiol-disulfide isomerase/thioredoxin
MSDSLRIVAYLAIACFVGSVAHAGDLESYLTGELAKLELLEKPVSLADHQITYPDGNKHALKEKNGKVLLVNLRARWCVPCKDEVKAFASLQRDLGDDRFEVVALPMKKRSIRSIRTILKTWGAEILQPYGNDPQALARVLFNEGLFTEREISFVYPTTYLVSKSGEVLAVREGFLHWDSFEARTLITALKDDEF